MRQNLIGLLVLLAVAILSSAPAALAQTCVAPPGQSAIEQYCESLPAPDGDRGSTARRPARESLPPSARRSREALARAGGADGQELARFLGASPSTRTDGKAGERVGGTGGEATATAATRGRIKERIAEAPANAGGVPSALGASSSSGVGLLVAVAAVAGLAWLGVLFGRRRRGERAT